MVLERKATGKEDYLTGTIYPEAPKMVARGVSMSTFAAAGDTVQYKPTTPVGPESCLLHTLNIVNTSDDDDNYVELYDHRGTDATTARRTRLHNENSPYLALSGSSSRGAQDTVVVDDSREFSVGDIVSIVADSDNGLVADSDKKDLTYEECVITAIPSNAAPGSLTLRRGTGGTSPQNHYDNAVVHGGRLRMKMLIHGRESRGTSLRDIKFPIPILLERGWVFRCYTGGQSADTAVIINATYTTLEHNAQRDQSSLISPYVDYIGQVENANQRFLRASWVGGQEVLEVTHWNTNYVEVYGDLGLSNSSDNYRTIYAKEVTANSNRLYHTVHGMDDGGDDEEDPQGPFGVMWYPYPIYCKGGLKVYHSATAAYSTVFYRPVQAYESDGSASMMDL